VKRYVKTRQHRLGNTLERVISVGNAGVIMKEFDAWGIDEVKTNIPGTGYIRWWYILPEGGKQ
jgi:hypothetical protein